MARTELRASRRALFPLLGIVAATFMPAVRACGTTRVPIDYVDGTDAALVLPPYVGAAILGLLTLLAVWRQRPGLGSRGLALLTVLALGAMGAVTNLVGVPKDSSWSMAALSVLCFAASVAVIRAGRGEAPWRIWEQLLAAYALAAMASWPYQFLARGVLILDEDTLSGAYVLVLSPLVLLVITAAAVRRALP